jgi:CheY-like chemotaxis protein
LAGGIAHDFNNLLAAIIANLHIAESELAPRHPARESLVQIDKASARAVRLVEGILSFSRRQARELHVLDLGPLVTEAAELLRATLPAGVLLIVRVGNSLPRVLADATEIHQTVLNLGTNAWQAMEGRPGEIRISVEPESIGDSHSPIPPEPRPGAYVRLTVEDTGRGMDQATVERIFEPFFTTKEVGAGTGLGLSVVHGIIKNMGGAIIVDSKLGRGTTLSVFIPQTEQVMAAPAPLLEQPTSARGQGQHLLLVEDEAGLLWAIKRILEREGYRVTAFAEGAAALAALRTAPGSFDLLITDQDMPGITGLEVVREARQLCPALPVVMTSGALGPAFLAEASAHGVEHVVQKPFPPDALCSLVYSLVSGL